MTKNKTIAIIHGPNLNTLGMRETSIYGTLTLKEINQEIITLAKQLGIDITIDQYNHEGDIVEKIHSLKNTTDALIINPAAYTHTSIAIRDAVLAVQIPFIEVHLSNIHAREGFRQHSYLADIAVAQLSGLGYRGYLFALQYFATI